MHKPVGCTVLALGKTDISLKTGDRIINVACESETLGQATP